MHCTDLHILFISLELNTHTNLWNLLSVFIWSPRVKNRHLITLKSVQSKYQRTFKVLINRSYNGCFLYCNAFLWFHTLYFYSQCVHIHGTFDQCTKAHIIYYLSSHFSNGSWQPHTLCINQGSFFFKKELTKVVKYDLLD